MRSRGNYHHPGFVETALVALIAIAFFGGGLIGAGLVPAAAAWVTELLIVMLYFEAFRQCRSAGRRLRFVGGRYALALLVITLLSWLASDMSAVSMLLFVRKLLRFYLLMVAVANVRLHEDSVRRLLRLMLFFFILQIPVAVVKSILYGQGERAIGTYAHHEGGNSTVIPMIAVAFLLPYYYLFRKTLWYSFLALGFLIFGIVGGKRGIVILVPVAAAFAAVCVRRTVGKHAFGRRQGLLIVSAILGGLMAFYLVSRLVPRLNPDREVWGRFSVEFAYERLRERLVTQEDEDVATQRVSATWKAFDYLGDKGLTTTLLGCGPGSFMKSIFKTYDTRLEERTRELGIVYGMTGLTWLALQVGVVGAFIWLAFFARMLFRVLRAAHEETTPYWRAYHVGMAAFCFVALIISCIYNVNMLLDDLAAFTFMVLLAFSLQRMQGTLVAETQQGTSPLS